jgi:hypothetical protein
MALEVVFVIDLVFPKTSLPNATFAALLARLCERSFTPAIHQIALRKRFLDAPPPCRIIVVAVREALKCVEMVGKEHDGVNFERPLGAQFGNRFSQTLTRQLAGQETPTLVGHEGEKIAATRDK